MIFETIFLILNKIGSSKNNIIWYRYWKREKKNGIWQINFSHRQLQICKGIIPFSKPNYVVCRTRFPIYHKNQPTTLMTQVFIIPSNRATLLSFSLHGLSGWVLHSWNQWWHQAPYKGLQTKGGDQGQLGGCSGASLLSLGWLSGPFEGDCSWVSRKRLQSCDLWHERRRKIHRKAFSYWVFRNQGCGCCLQMGLWQSFFW